VEEFHGTAQALLDGRPEAVFAVLIDVAGLPRWNAKVHHVIKLPDGPLQEDSEWVIEMRAMWSRWASRSHATTLDPADGRFEHTSRTVDDNPSYTLWSWEIRPDVRGSRLTVSWAMHARTRRRRLLAAPLRRPVLANEVQTSLAALNRYINSLDPAIR
jgi:Polyketide cyclase / dehydrase and lipid transport